MIRLTTSSSAPGSAPGIDPVDAEWTRIEEERVADEVAEAREDAIEAMREALPVFGRKIRGFDMPDALVACVDDVPIFRAHYGVSRGNYALKVVEMLRHSDLTPRHKELGASS
mgnify:CR=1 FL=1